MAKKEGKKKSKSFLGNIFGEVFSEIFSGLILVHIKDWLQSLLRDIQESIYYTLTKVLESFLAFSLMVIGIFMILISLPFMISHYTGLPASLLFVIMGLVVLLISVISFAKINKTKFKEE